MNRKMSPAMSVPWLAGYIPDLPTPFDQADRIDLPAFARLCERQIEGGASAIVVCETGGEAATLSPAEQGMLIRAAPDAARGRVRIIAGAGSNSTEHAIELTRLAEASVADAIISVVPYYNKPMQDDIFAHFHGNFRFERTARHSSRHSIQDRHETRRRNTCPAMPVQPIRRAARRDRRNHASDALAIGGAAGI